MFAYIEQHWESVGKPDDIGDLLSELSLWDTESGGKEPMDAAVFPDWLRCAHLVLEAEATPVGYRGADIQMVGGSPSMKVHR